MRLSELVSDLTPATFTTIATVIFFTVFISILIRTFLPSARDEQRRALQLPLSDGERGEP
jgi:cbb3-type cytochrome oxidase subunit 3